MFGGCISRAVRAGAFPPTSGAMFMAQAVRVTRRVVTGSQPWRAYGVSAEMTPTNGGAQESNKDDGLDIDVATAGHEDLRKRVPLIPREYFKTNRAALKETKRRFRQALDGFDTTEILTANQIGVEHRAIAYEITPAYIEELGETICEELLVEEVPFRVLFNPKFFPVNKHDKMTISEGNISVPFYGAYVERYSRIKVEALTEVGTKVTFTARGHESSMIQQAVELLDGVMFTDKMVKETLVFAGNVTGAEEAEDTVIQEVADHGVPDVEKLKARNATTS